MLLYLYDEQDSSAEEIISFIKEFYRPDLKVMLLHNKIDQNKGVSAENLPEIDQTLKRELVPDYTDTILGIFGSGKYQYRTSQSRIVQFRGNSERQRKCGGNYQSAPL